MTEDREKFLRDLLGNANALHLLCDSISNANYALANSIDIQDFKKIEFYCNHFENTYKSLHLFAVSADKNMFEKTITEFERLLGELPFHVKQLKNIFEEQSKLAKENTH